MRLQRAFELVNSYGIHVPGNNAVCEIANTMIAGQQLVDGEPL